MANANQRVSEYVLDQKIGAGTFGEVWRAHHHVWVDQVVAIKIPTDSQYVRNLQREGVAIHGLVHPNVVRAMGFDPYAETPYLVMEYVPGKSLRELIREKSRLSPDESVAIMRQVLSGLAYAHGNGITHRDVKPENILVHDRAFREGFAAEGVIKVTDFGLGKAANQAAVGSVAYSMSIQHGGNDIAGTLDYMAPEQRGGGDVDARVDLYACGVVLYEMLTGQKPAGHEVPSELAPGIPKFLDEAFKKAYARVEKRFASAEEFAKALKAAGGPPPLPHLRGHATACRHCRRPVDPNDQFCMHCGMQLVAEVRRCNKCGAYPDVADRYCLFCGTEFSGTPAQSAAATTKA